MKISKEEFKIIIEYTFRSGMNYGYGVEHENITESENEAWDEFYAEIKNKYKLV